MERKLALAVPEKGAALSEMKRFFAMTEADIFLFPEGFLEEEDLPRALELSREQGKFFIAGLVQRGKRSCQKAVVVDHGELIGEYQKNILTPSEREKGRQPGEKIHCIDTRFGRIGIPICYELHFPEVSRVMSLDDPCCLVNLIGTGMYHELQYTQWLTLAKARAIENEVYVFGCSHANGEIPIAFAIAPDGSLLGERKNEPGCLVVTADLSKSHAKTYRYLEDRLPDRFQRLAEEQGAIGNSIAAK